MLIVISLYSAQVLLGVTISISKPSIINSQFIVSCHDLEIIFIEKLSPFLKDVTFF